MAHCFILTVITLFILFLSDVIVNKMCPLPSLSYKSNGKTDVQMGNYTSFWDVWSKGCRLRWDAHSRRCRENFSWKSHLNCKLIRTYSGQVEGGQRRSPGGDKTGQEGQGDGSGWHAWRNQTRSKGVGWKVQRESANAQAAAVGRPVRVSVDHRERFGLWPGSNGTS